VSAVCLITGGTDGVGKVTALELARKGLRVVIAARNGQKAEGIRREIRASTGGDADCIVGDLASLRQVRHLAESFRARHSRLDVLVNNAGVFLPKRAETEDGFEMTYQVNYLSHFLLTHLLLEDLKKSEQGRIINLSSSVYTVGRFDAQNLQGESQFSPLGAYSASKLFMLMFTKELARRLAGTRVTANAVHPGIVRTPMMRNAPGILRVVAYLSMPFSVSPEKGARTSVHLATAAEVSGLSGRYFANSKTERTKSKFDTEENRTRLWDLSMKALQLQDGAAAVRPSELGS
jgi:retinol dehydrogenase 12